MKIYNHTANKSKELKESCNSDMICHRKAVQCKKTSNRMRS